ncbi:unnamed protein product [Paramecium octaurelia]|uniref:Uncharacterized protein n=1 Tax=Paramecium octaurelia TaxID=43137 RepID=A0A8S1YJN1_PAROT|nr:unnamed protein product [Paramecium octaurelia]
MLFDVQCIANSEVHLFLVLQITLLSIGNKLINKSSKIHSHFKIILKELFQCQIRKRIRLFHEFLIFTQMFGKQIL